MTETRAAVPRRLLLASDDLMFPSRIREAIRDRDFELETGATADAVLAAMRERPPVVVLVNLNARRYDPLSLIQAIKSDPSGSAVPLIAFAGHVETGKHEAARAAGADLVAANSSVSLHLPRLLARVLGEADGAEDSL